VGKFFAGLGSKSPINRLAGRQKDLKSWLNKPTDKNISKSKKELISCEDDLKDLSKLWAGGSAA